MNNESLLNAHVDAVNPRPPAISAGCALFLDVDGCLLEFADDPWSVRATPRLIAALDALEQRLDGALALVSGRTLSAIDAVFAPARYTAIGLHGLERRGDAHASTRDPRLAAIVDAARMVLDAYSGTLIEDKGRSLALHWRAAPAAGAEIHAFAMQALAQLPGYRLEPGNQVIELRPDRGDKGSAIRDLMASPRFSGRTPVFAGDDLTDEAGFAAVNAMGGISVLVGERLLSAATHRLVDPAAVRAWLEELP
ncbi:MAG: trehalose-phosphatase [Proteobacteria bacterium]|nr:trehalose-phosphatase [Pseudomonadota bacterium]